MTKSRRLVIDPRQLSIFIITRFAILRAFCRTNHRFKFYKQSTCDPRAQRNAFRRRDGHAVKDSQKRGAPSLRRTCPATAVSVGFGLCFDDVGTGACIAIVSPDPVVIERVRTQTIDVLTGYGDRQIPVSRYVSAEGIARGYV